MTTHAEQAGSEGPEGLIFLPGTPGGIDVSGNPERLLSGVEMAILTGRPPFEAVRGNVKATEILHDAFVREKARILGGQALVLSAEV